MRIKTCLLCALHTFLNGASHSLKKKCCNINQDYIVFLFMKTPNKHLPSFCVVPSLKMKPQCFPSDDFTMKNSNIDHVMILNLVSPLRSCLVKRGNKPLERRGKTAHLSVCTTVHPLTYFITKNSPS